MGFLINTAFGKDDIEKASVPLVVGNAAAGRGETRIFLTTAAVELAMKGRITDECAPGYAPVADLIDGAEIAGGWPHDGLPRSRRPVAAVSR